jgi:hypothetical protein
VSTKFYPGSLKGRHHLGDIGIDGKIILIWSVRCGVESSYSGDALEVDGCGCGSEYSDSINDEEFRH